MGSKANLLFVPLIVLSSLLGGSQARAQPTPPADALITGQSADDDFGWRVAPAGDVNGDGAPDLIVGAPSNDAVAGFAGRAYLFHGPITGNLNAANADAIISAEAFGDNLGFSVASAGDVNDDGFDDVLIGARGNDTPGIQAGRVYLFLGPISGNRPATSADAIISGGAFEEVGRAVAPAGDLDGDGFDDILLGTDLGGPSDEGQAFLFYGPISGPLPVTSADAIINGTFASESLGASVAPAGDVNGDGIGDIVVGAPHFPLGSNGTGRAYVFYGPISGVISAASANAILFGEGLNDSFGTSVAAGDVNGDSVSDVVVGADQLFTVGTGKAYVFYGPLSGPIQAANADAILLGEGADALFGTSVAAGDVNGDGFDDAIAGAWDQDGGGGRSGRAYVFHGPLSGTIPAANADFIVTGSAGDQVGHWVSAGDVDDDGVSDLLVGAPQFTDGAPGYAAVFSQAKAAAVAPFALAVDTAGNGVLQPNETAIMAPAWRNTGTAPITLTGATSSFTGPAGAVYTNPDNTASYGTLGVAGQGTCETTGDCYGIRATAAMRPLTHWDGTILETVTPTSTTRTWTLHVGDSFTDVPPSNGFYRFVETILHKGVTGGCTATAYCPTSSTTREQMAVFVLVSRESFGFVPPPCGATPMFPDVPVSSPFCPWVEELARRGVVSGCGGGNYCPSSSATREQMAVFVLRTLDPALDPPPCTTPVFSDVPASSGFCRWIEELFRRGVVTGCGGGNYCPTADVSREQMSVFLVATFGLTLYGL